MKKSNRGPIRFEGDDDFIVEVKCPKDEESLFIGSVSDFNLCGCQISTSKKISEEIDKDRKLELVFSINGCQSKGEPVKSVAKACSIEDDSLRVEFARPLRLERIGEFGQFFLGHKADDPFERLRSYSQQEKLAFEDLSQLHSEICDTKTRQFQMFMVVIPALAGLLLTSFLLVAGSGEANQSQIEKTLTNILGAAALVPVPVFTSFLSVVAMVVFLQKASSLRARTAFCTLLQRYIAMKHFPPGYRGWHDARANYNQEQRKSVNDETKIWNPKAVWEGWGISRKMLFTRDPFMFSSILSFISISTLSLILSYFAIQKSNLEKGWTMSLGIILTLVLLAYAYAIYNEIRLQFGHKSTRHMMIIYSEMMKCFPPFDPQNSGPIPLRSRK